MGSKSPPLSACKRLSTIWKHVESRLRCASVHLTQLLCGTILTSTLLRVLSFFRLFGDSLREGLGLSGLASSLLFGRTRKFLKGLGFRESGVRGSGKDP